MLLGAEGVDLVFTDASIQEIANYAEQVNSQVENIGARRLHTILERLVEDISFDAPEKVAAAIKENGGAGGAAGGGTEPGSQYTHVIDKETVQEKVGDLLKKQDLSKYIL